MREIEDARLREELSRNGHEFISRYVPEGEPRAHWREVLRGLGTVTR